MKNYVSLRIALHTEHPGDVVEVWDGDTMIAAIYSVERGIRILSKYGPEPAMIDPIVLDVRFGKARISFGKAGTP